jgi:hypothetical protein
LDLAAKADNVQEHLQEFPPVDDHFVPVKMVKGGREEALN